MQAGCGMFPIPLPSQHLYREMWVGACGFKECRQIWWWWVRTGNWYKTRSKPFETSCNQFGSCQGRRLQRLSSCTGCHYLQWWRRVWVRCLEMEYLKTRVSYFFKTTSFFTMIGKLPHGGQRTTWLVNRSAIMKKGIDDDNPPRIEVPLRHKSCGHLPRSAAWATTPSWPTLWFSDGFKK